MESGPRTKLQRRQTRVVQCLQVRVERGPDAGLRASSEDAGPVTVGASPDNRLVLTDPLVSRYHLELRHLQEGISVADLGSRNGTFLGQVRAERVVVPPGTRLGVGSSLLVVEDAGAAVAPVEEEADVPELVGASEAMQEVRRLVLRLAGAPTSVLIEGETGCGKEVVARALHRAGPSREQPFVVLDCGSMPATLVSSQLFGHERGAFTGAAERHVGAFERAHGGTLLLDEIGELPLEVQPALLGVLERRAFTRVGGHKEIRVDVRVLAATHRDLRAEVNRGGFRADLYYRLAIARIVLPPLRERLGDLEALVRHFVEKLTGVPDGLGALSAPGGPLEDMDALRKHRWSGNVRELRNVVEVALVMGRLQLEGRDPPPSAAGRLAGPPLAYRDARAEALATFEREYLTKLLGACAGNASEAARRAHMDRPYLLSLLSKHGLR